MHAPYMQPKSLEYASRIHTILSAACCTANVNCIIIYDALSLPTLFPDLYNVQQQVGDGYDIPCVQEG